MRRIKSIISVCLALCILTSIIGCGKKAKNSNSKNSSTKSSSEVSSVSSEDNSSYDETVDKWKEDNNSKKSSTDFNDSSDDTIIVTPGENGPYSVEPMELDKDNNTNSGKQNESTQNNSSVKKDYHSSLPESVLSDKETLQYFYEGSDYAYGISNAGYEFIAYKAENGKLYDVLTGGGKYSIATTSGAKALNIANVATFNQTMNDSYTAVEVTYSLTGLLAKNTTLRTTYTFKEHSITYSSEISTKGSVTLSSERSSLSRGFVNGTKSSLVRVDDRWVYPENGDYPYPWFDNLNFRDQIDDTLYVYTIMRGDDMNTTYGTHGMNGNNLPLSFSDSTGLHYSVNYDLAFVDTTADGTNADYIGRFKCDSGDFAAGISPAIDTGDNSSVFTGNEARLNLNVTNLTDEDLKFSLRYDIRDYYGNVVDKGMFIDSKVYKYSAVNRNISVKNKYGIFYLNLYAISQYSKYSECYPFALLPSYTYKYNATSPFGLSTATSADSDIIKKQTAHLTTKLGFANYRVSGVDQFTTELHKLGITQINGHLNAINDNPSKVSDYVQRAVSATENLKDYIDSMEVGNEMSLEASRKGGRPLEQLYPLFYNNTFIPTYNAIKAKFPNLLYVPTPFSACEQAWINMFSEGYVDKNNDGIADSDEKGNLIRNYANGSWSFVDAVATHIYGHPYMPDSYGVYGTPKWGAGMWHIEQGMQRMSTMMDNHRNLRNGKKDPEFYLTEVGYPTDPIETSSVCLRTQADYSVRLGVICIAYGVDRVQYFRLNDRTSTFSGFRDNIEWNFGLAYQEDYYGVSKPKPAIIAIGAMTRELESLKKDGASIYSKYDEGYQNGGVRAILCKTALKGNVVVAWSNNEVLPNGKKNSVGSTGDREPTLPWNNQWKKTDDTVFDASGEKVTVVDTMGNETVYKVKNGKVTIPLTGSPVYIHGVK